jgi:uroporphyrinogen decarboxylase
LKTEPNTSKRKIVQVLDGETLFPPPIWIMRQAGRYLPEYREVRKRAGSFLDLCYSPEFACEVTLQPINRYGFDAAILFSDILVVPHGLGQQVWFEDGVGPRLTPLDVNNLDGLSVERMMVGLMPVFDAVSMIRAELPVRTTLLGFCGAPWTVATYMIAGRGTTDQAPARLAAMTNRQQFTKLIDILVEASTQYLIGQLNAGADAVQIFDTWSGVLVPRDFQTLCVDPVRRIISGVRSHIPNARIIGYPKGAAHMLPEFVQATGVNAVGLDWTVPLDWAVRDLQGHCALQGNLDPLRLVAGGDDMDRDIGTILEALSGGPFIFNLGHGITPQTPTDHVARLVDRVRQHTSKGC